MGTLPNKRLIDERTTAPHMRHKKRNPTRRRSALPLQSNTKRSGTVKPHSPYKSWLNLAKGLVHRHFLRTAISFPRSISKMKWRNSTHTLPDLTCSRNTLVVVAVLNKYFFGDFQLTDISKVRPETSPNKCGIRALRRTVFSNGADLQHNSTVRMDHLSSSQSDLHNR